MQNREDDLFFRHLNDKLDELKGENASEQDWQNFQNAYKQHQKPLKRRKVAFWLTAAALISLCGFIAWNRLPSTSNPPLAAQQETELLTSIPPHKKSSELNSIDANHANVDEHQKAATNKSIPTTSPETAVWNNQSSSNPQTPIRSRLRKKMDNKPGTQNQAAVQSIIPQLVPASLSNTSIQPVSLPPLMATSYPEEIALTSSNAQNNSVELSLTTSTDTITSAKTLQQNSVSAKTYSPSLNVPAQTLYDSTRIKKDPSAFPNLWFVEFNAIAYTSYGPRQPYPSDVFYMGGGMNLAYKLRQNLTFIGGFNYAVMQEINTIVLNQEYSKDEIVSIDTSLKLNPADNRIGLQIDTITQTKTYSTESSIKLNTDKSILAIPLALQYTIGSAKFGISAQAGITTLFLTETATTLHDAGLPSEKQESNTTHKVTLAPTIGIGVYKKVYRTVDVHLGGNYLYLLPNGLSQYSIFQLQTGLRYHF